jgi:hypothetical protein
MELVKKHGQQRWTVIADYLHGRIGKQCRERWHNHLRPDIKVPRSSIIVLGFVRSEDYVIRVADQGF